MGVGEQDDRLMPGALAPTALDYKKVLGHEFPDALEFGDPEASVFALPVVEGRLADTVLAAHVGDFHPGMGLLEDRRDLALREFALLHGSVSLVTTRILYFQPVSPQGKLTHPGRVWWQQLHQRHQAAS